MKDMTMQIVAQPTGDHCAECKATSYFVPGYLHTQANGRKYFTVARRTDHATGCTSLSYEQN